MIKTILVWALVALAVGMLVFTVISVNSFDQNNRAIFGRKFFVVRSDSMSASGIHAGDIVVIRDADPTTLTEGDIIAYISQNTDIYGQTVTHMIRSRTTTATGEPGFVTYGTTTGVDDELIVTYPYVLGKFSTRVPKLGLFFTFLRTVPGYISCILLPFLLLIAYQGVNCIRLFRRYKEEEMEKVQEERKRLEAEREASQKMMAELLELRKQLSAEKAAVQQEEAAPSVASDTQPTEPASAAVENDADAAPTETPVNS